MTEWTGIAEKKKEVKSEKKKTISEKKSGPDRDSNPGPLAPKARIIPLDHQADKYRTNKLTTDPNYSKIFDIFRYFSINIYFSISAFSLSPLKPFFHSFYSICVYKDKTRNYFSFYAFTSRKDIDQTPLSFAGSWEG